MQPNPKRVNNNEEKDYTQIYEENFVKRNDPAVLGTAAMNRQMSQGVANSLNSGGLSTPTLPPVNAIDLTGSQQSTFVSSDDNPFVDPTDSDRAGAGSSQGGAEGSLSPDDGPSLPGSTSDSTGEFGQDVDAEVERLQGLIADEDKYLNEEFNKYYNQLLRQAERRSARSGASPFTGGIASQLEEFLSAAEIESLGNLKMERDRQQTALNQRKDPEALRQLAIKNIMERKAGDMSSLAQNLQYTQDLAGYVLDGRISLEYANEVAAELGLGQVDEVIVSAIATQIRAGTITEEAAIAELEARGIDPAILDEELEEIKKGQGGPRNTEENIQAANDFRDDLDDILSAYDKNSIGEDQDWFNIVAASAVSTATAGAAAGATIGGGSTLGIGTVPGWIVGGILGLVVGGIAGIITYESTTRVDARDIAGLYNPLYDSGILTADFVNGDLDVSVGITKSPTANNSTSYLDDTYLLDIGGEQYVFEGADLLTLATVLAASGHEDKPAYRDIFTQAAIIFQRGDGGLDLEAMLGLKRSNALKIYRKMFK